MRPDGPGRRERNKADKVARLRAAAAALFRERGFQGTTIRDVAARADLGVGTVYAYVKDKHALLELISADDLARTEEAAFARVPPDDLRAGVLHVFRHVYAHHGEDPELARVLVGELTFARDATAPARNERFAVFIGRVAALVAAAQARGEIAPDLVPFAVASQLFGLHFFILVLWLKGDLDDPDAAFAAAFDLQHRGLRPLPASAPKQSKSKSKSNSNTTSTSTNRRKR